MNKKTAPNIILIMTDQHRHDFLGCTGHPVLQTPNIDQLASQSVLFQNAYCSDPVCGPARASIFTGMYPPANGVLRNHIVNSSRRPLLTDRLASMGYYNALIGKLHLSPVQARHGFDYKRHCDSPHAVYDAEEIINNPYREWIEEELFDNDSRRCELEIAESEMLGSTDPDFWLGKSWCDDAHHNTTWTGNESVAFLEKWQQKQPLFLNVSFFGPHHPYSTCEPWDSMYSPDSVELPQNLDSKRTDPIFADLIPKRRQSGNKWTEQVWKKIIASYQGAISQIDREVGRIISTLKKAGMWENSVIIFCADHGDELADFGFTGKGLMTEASARIPFIIKPAGSTTKNTICNQCVNSMDLFATCLELAGESNWRTEEDEKVESRSLLPLLTGNDSNWKNETFVMDGIDHEIALAMIRRDNLKLVRMGRSKLSPMYELYDLSNKPYDTINIFGEKKYADEQQDMVEALESWWEKQLDRYPDRNTMHRLSIRKLRI